jgi:hypothetical protein
MLSEEKRTFVPNIMSPHMDEDSKALYAQDYAIPSRFYQEPVKKAEKVVKLGPASKFFPQISSYKNYGNFMGQDPIIRDADTPLIQSDKSEVIFKKTD